MGSRDHSFECEVCGIYRGGLNELKCDCDYEVKPFYAVDLPPYSWISWDSGLENLWCNIEVVLAIEATKRVSYAKGFSDGTLLREFCDDYTPEAYFPMPDSRPTADRLGWAKL